MVWFWMIFSGVLAAALVFAVYLVVGFASGSRWRV